MDNEEYLKSISEPRAMCILILKNCEIEGELNQWYEDSNVIKNLCCKYQVDYKRGCKKELHKKMLLSWLEEESNN